MAEHQTAEAATDFVFAAFAAFRLTPILPSMFWCILEPATKVHAPRVAPAPPPPPPRENVGTGKNVFPSVRNGFSPLVHQVKACVIMAEYLQ